MAKLTERSVKGLKSPASGYTLTWDDEVKGFGVRTTTGSKNFIFNYRTRGGKLCRMTIGRWPAWSVDMAREAAKDHDREVSRGHDPLAHRQGERDAPTFKDLCDYYVERHLPTKRPSSAKTDVYTIDKVLMPKLGKLKVAEITADDIDGIHYRITKAGHPYRANRVLAQLSKMFALAVRPKGWRADNPAIGIARNHKVEARAVLVERRAGPPRCGPGRASRPSRGERRQVAAPHGRASRRSVVSDVGSDRLRAGLLDQAKQPHQAKGGAHRSIVATGLGAIVGDVHQARR